MKEKERYFAPEIKVMGICYEGVVCASTIETEGTDVVYNNPFGDSETDL